MKDQKNPNIEKSIQYLTQSANNNNSMASFLLGNLYYKYELIEKDIKKAIYYLTISANLDIIKLIKKYN